MNVTGFSDDNNDSFVGNQSVKQHGDSAEPWLEWATIDAVRDVTMYVVYALGIPGNILSAIVWLRRHVASENPSAIYLAALAIDDLVYLIVDGFRYIVRYKIIRPIRGLSQLSNYLMYPHFIAGYLEPLLVLGFSVVRLIAIRRPLQVCCMRFIARATLF